MKDHLYERLYEIRNVADEHIEEYQELFEKMYNERFNVLRKAYERFKEQSLRS
jgi:coenzyme F420-reducing hydrogenase alpha subunit